MKMQLKIESVKFPRVVQKNSYENEFHIASHLRKKYDFSEDLFSFSGNVIFANFAQVRKFVAIINADKDDDSLDKQAHDKLVCIRKVLK